MAQGTLIEIHIEGCKRAGQKERGAWRSVHLIESRERSEWRGTPHGVPSQALPPLSRAKHYRPKYTAPRPALPYPTQPHLSASSLQLDTEEWLRYSIRKTGVRNIEDGAQ